MPETYRILITPTAQEHLRDIAGYIAVDIDSPQAAARLLDYLQAQIRSLAMMPERTPLADDVPAKDMGIHKMTARNYLVYYWINRQKHAVHVLAVLYGRRDQLTHLMDAIAGSSK